MKPGGHVAQAAALGDAVPPVAHLVDLKLEDIDRLRTDGAAHPLQHQRVMALRVDGHLLDVCQLPRAEKGVQDEE